MLELFHVKKDIPFMRHALKFNIVSLLTFIAAVVFLMTKGLHFGVDFTGGTVMEVAYKQTANLDRVRSDLQSIGFPDAVVQNFGTSRDVMIRLPIKKGLTSAQLSENIMTKLKSADGSVELRRVEFVGPAVGEELFSHGLTALGIVIAGIVLYLSLRFEWRFAVAAIIANLHDVIIILGFFSLFQWEFDLPVLAGVLAVLGYSVNESVVVFDRVRENFRKMRKGEVSAVIDNAITSTMSRTIITHLSTQMMVTSMLFLGGPTLHNFALALTIGICFGIYSSVLVSCPLAMWLGVKREHFIVPVKKKEEAVV
ncbi:preprotein translocase subunit SecF [Chitinivorax tropicus]|uniref:Protein-export membrane protein SecF n=1 Tax=Chitinivorax tropicus TaxID=714531 RepID=A0A840MSW1_9PROT|nr:protein translocase subunit SecF [Chitinivorax tropicus]MBB5020277.1 preprotein translocase subunit SecF [Chitinivorax tropicus]